MRMPTGISQSRADTSKEKTMAASEPAGLCERVIASARTVLGERVGWA